LARIAVDAMGGDDAPRAPVAGAIQALAEIAPGDTIQLVGPASVIERELQSIADADGTDRAAFARQRERLAVIDAPDVIDMTDRPSSVLRAKPKSSMVIGLRHQTEGLSDAFVSAGNTGAQMVASAVVLKLHTGIRRPAIGTLFPTLREPVVVLDSGANVDCSAAELVQFAHLGAVYAEDLLGRPNPVIGLLNIGEEEEKGNAVVKEAHRRLREAKLNFQGNVEGRDIPQGASERGPIDVVVCDGFVGNILLKFYEAVAPTLVAILTRRGIDRGTLERALAAFDYAEPGGAPLLGVRGVSIICHGKSSARAIKNAIKLALRAVESRMSEHIERRLADVLGALDPAGGAGGAGGAGAPAAVTGRAGS
jgi:glycerol-3-phosphate acyltransferase PlsX